MCLLLLSDEPIKQREQPLVRWLQRAYETVLARIVQRPRPVFVATAFMILVGLAVLPLLGESLFPHFKERDFLIHWITKPGTSVIGRAADRDSTQQRAAGHSRSAQLWIPHRAGLAGR